MKYTKIVFALLSGLWLMASPHAGMQDRIYDELLIDNVVHPHGEDISLAEGPDGRIYLSYAYDYDHGTESNIDGWVEVYTAQGELLTTIEKADIPTLSSSSTFAPSSVLPGPDGTFAISHWDGTTVFRSDFEFHRHVSSGYQFGWIQSLDGGLVTFDYDNDWGTNTYSLYRRVRDSSGALLETETFAFDSSISNNDILQSGYSVTVLDYPYEQLTFDVDGTLLSRTEVHNFYDYDQPRLENGQVLVTRRAYRTKGDSNAIPLPKILSVEQRPDTTLVDISYRVDDADDDSVTVGILASMTDDQGQTSRLPLATLVEDTAANLGAGVPTNTDVTVTWDAGVDWGAAYGDVSFDIYVNDGRPLLGFHMLTLPLPDGDLTISRSPVNDLEFKEALDYLWATGQGLRLDADGQLVGQGDLFEGVLLGSPDEPVTEASRSLVLHQLGLQEASAAQVEAARNGFDADTVYQFEPKHPIRGDLLNYSQLPSYVNELGFDSVSTSSSAWWVVPAEPNVLPSSLSATGLGGELAFTILDPNNAGWSLTTSADWLSISGPTSGVGNASVSLALAANSGLLSRSTTVEVNGGAASVSVTQTGDLWPDDFANRYTLSGESGLIEVNNAGATLEDGEPSHHYGNGGNSLWFTFTAPVSGELFLSTVGSNFDTFISVYAGTDLSSLTLINEYDDGGSEDEYFNEYDGGSEDEYYHTEAATLTMEASQTYQIAIGGWSGDTGDLVITLEFTADAE
ncbi:MAG: BACON domain-containing protein [Opitutales bacterium]